MKKIIILIFLVLFSELVYGAYTPPDSINGRNIYDIYNFKNIYNITNITAVKFFGDGSGLTNIVYTETDPVFTAWDKDYNDLINRPDLSLYYLASNPSNYISNAQETDQVFVANRTSIWDAIGLRLLITDQRYNDTAAINTKLTATDQRYNDTAAIIAVDNRVTSINSTKALVGSSTACTYGVSSITLNPNSVPTVTCASAQGDIMGVTATSPGLTGGGSSGVVTMGLNDSYINSKWNDTALINAVNNSLQAQIALQAANNVTQAAQISSLSNRESANNLTQANLISSINGSLMALIDQSNCVGENTFSIGFDGTYNYCNTVNTSALNIPFSSLSNYPAPCSPGYAVTGLGDSVTCTAFVQESTSPTFTSVNVRNISFYNSTGTIRNTFYLSSDNSDAVRFSGIVYGNLGVVSDKDIYTTGAGDDLWLGSPIQSAALSNIKANGIAVFNTSVTTKNVTVTDRVCLNSACTSYMYNNGTGVIII